MILNGEGYLIIKYYTDKERTVLAGSLDMPYTQKGGFTERWTEESFIHRLQGLDFDEPEITEKQFVTGFWGEWEFSWAGLSIPKETWLSLRSILSGRREGTSTSRTKYYLSIIPRSDYQDIVREFAVNYIGKGLEDKGNTGGSSAYGNKGLTLEFRTIKTQNIGFADPLAVSYTVVQHFIRPIIVTE